MRPIQRYIYFDNERYNFSFLEFSFSTDSWKIKKEEISKNSEYFFLFFFPFRLTRAISIRIEYRSRNLNKFALIAERIDRW